MIDLQEDRMMKKDFPSIIGNDFLCHYFASAIRSSTLSHAYILLGAKGTGKHTLALSVAAALNCENKQNDASAIPCGECVSCKKILQKNSADVTVLGKEDKATIGVDAVRFIKNDIATMPNDGDFKIYIIEDAHTMTKQAQNALLLTLEEPPPYAIFLLLCENEEDILETIKSRAPILRINTPTNEMIVEYLRQNFPSARMLMNNSPEEFEQLLKASGGSIGKIVDLIDGKERKQILHNRKIATTLISSLADRTLSSSFADVFLMFSQKRDELSLQLNEIRLAARDLMLIKKSDDPPLVFFTEVSLAEELSYSFSLKALSDLLDSTEEAREAITKNANVRLTLVNFLSSLL